MAENGRRVFFLQQEEGRVREKCPFCAEMIQDEATKCRFCGEFLALESKPFTVLNEPAQAERDRLAEIRRLQRIASGRPTRTDSIRKTKGILAVIIIGAILLYAYQWNRIHRPRPVSPAQTKVSFRAFNAIFGPESPLSLQDKQEEFAGLKGNTVVWDGTVAYINLGTASELYMTVRHQAATQTSDVVVRFREQNREQVERLKVGERVTYGGKLADYGPQTAFFTLEDGFILPADR